MKKYFFLLALVLAPLAFISCSDDDGEGGSVSLKAPKYADDAIKFEIPGGGLTIPIKGGSPVVVKAIELTEDGQYLITYDMSELTVKETRGSGSEAIGYLMGNFTKQGATYVLESLGTLNIATKDGKNYTISLIPEGEAEAIVSNAVSIIFDLFPGSKQLTEYLCRTWEIKEYKLIYTKTNSTPVAKVWNGTCDLRKIAEYAKNEHGVDINLGDLNGKEIIEGIFFTKGHTFQINYKNTDKKDVGEWAWTSINANENTGAIGYAWNGDDMGNDILCGVATVEFEGSTCMLNLKADVKAEGIVEVRFTMK